MASTLNISLPDPLKDYVEAQTEAGDYGTPSQFIRELVQDDLDRRAALLEQRLLAAMDGEAQAIELTSEEVRRGGVVALLKSRTVAKQ